MTLDWSEDDRVHADRRNLIIHWLAGPLFDVAFVVVLLAAAQGRTVIAAVSIRLAVGAIDLQGLRHSKEAQRPQPCAASWNYLNRWFSEQDARFPAIVMTRRWWRPIKTAGG